MNTETQEHAPDDDMEVEESAFIPRAARSDRQLMESSACHGVCKGTKFVSK